MGIKNIEIKGMKDDMQMAVLMEADGKTIMGLFSDNRHVTFVEVVGGSISKEDQKELLAFIHQATQAIVVTLHSVD